MLSLAVDRKRWTCPAGHSFDIAREGYVNLLRAGPKKSRQAGDNREMVAARRRFLATGAYDPISDVVAAAVAGSRPYLALDVGCGEGRYTRRLSAPLVLGIDVSKPAVATAAKADGAGSYAVASASDVPLPDGRVDTIVSVFGPVMPGELARIVRPGGVVIAAHPGRAHLAELRQLVYPDARPHEEKSPLRGAGECFVEEGAERVSFPIEIEAAENLHDLFAMTPYRWHAPGNIISKLAAACAPRFSTRADVLVTTYRRTAQPAPRARP